MIAVRVGEIQRVPMVLLRKKSSEESGLRVSRRVSRAISAISDYAKGIRSAFECDPS